MKSNVRLAETYLTIEALVQSRACPVMKHCGVCRRIGVLSCMWPTIDQPASSEKNPENMESRAWKQDCKAFQLFTDPSHALRYLGGIPLISERCFSWKSISAGSQGCADEQNRSAITLPIYNQIQIWFLYQNNQTNFIYILKLYIAHMRCSRENAVIHRA